MDNPNSSTIPNNGTNVNPSIIEAASAYIKKGWAPVPIKPGQKNPTLDGWQKYIATEETVLKDFSDTGGVGIILGDPSKGLLDVDLDTPQAVYLGKRWLPKTGLISGRTGRPRSHYWYQVDGKTKTRKFQDPTKEIDGEEAKKAMLIELRSTGGQTVVAPSRHPEGGFYSWDEGGEPKNLPYRELYSSVAFVAAGSLFARHYPPHGIRQNAVLAFAGWLLGQGMPEDKVSDFLVEVANAAGAEAEDAIIGCIRNTADKRKAGEPATGRTTVIEEEYLPEKVVSRIEKYLTSAGAFSETAGTAHNSATGAIPNIPKPEEELLLPKPTVVEASEYRKMKFPPTEYLFDTLIVKGGLTLIASLPKAGKSTTIRFLIRQLLHNRELFGCDAQLENPVVAMVDFETAPEQEFQEYINEIDPPQDTLHIIRHPYAFGEKPDKELEALLWGEGKSNPNVVFIDTVGKFYPSLEDNNSYSEVQRFLTALKSLCNKHHCSIVIAHHNAKGDPLAAVPSNKEDAMRCILGSVGWRAAPDCNIVMFKYPNDESHVVFYGEQRAQANPAFTFHTKYNHDDHSYSTASDMELSVKEKRVLEILFEAHEPLSKSAITAKLPKSWGKANKAIIDLVNKHKIASGQYFNQKNNKWDTAYTIGRYIHMLKTPSMTAADFAPIGRDDPEETFDKLYSKAKLGESGKQAIAEMDEKQVSTGIKVSSGSATNTPGMGQDGVGTINTKNTATEVAGTVGSPIHPLPSERNPLDIPKGWDGG